MPRRLTQRKPRCPNRIGRERTGETVLRSRNAPCDSTRADDNPWFLKFEIESMHSGALRGTARPLVVALRAPLSGPCHRPCKAPENPQERR